MEKKSDKIKAQCPSSTEEDLIQTNKKLVHLANKLTYQKKLLEKLNLALFESEQRFQLSFEYAAIGMGLVAPGGQWIKVNKSLCHLLRYSEEELLQLDFQTITYPDDLEKNLIHQQKMLSGEISTFQTQKRYIRKDGKVIWILLSVALARDQFSNEPLYFITQVQNIDDQKKAEEKLKKMVNEDPLTGLLNRKALEAAFKKMKKNLSNHLFCGIYFIDLDYFKHINDKNGHLVGDKILRIISKRMKNKLRDTDILARTGGDEFVIIAKDLKDGNEVLKIAKSLQVSISKPIKIDGISSRITASIGISRYPTDGNNLKDLLQVADRAMYDIKELGRDDIKLQ
ncbi:GGDEF domain-containing protein [Legionella impletisoli]|uniref:Uncharacterized protein n=1 Tax=Legionella impletisoli TaxID=343510 RepID=A0A917NA74_9GAMM|nr:GGDEF domain-containing protein [Legionella impletisoli]GGI80967.1 hypothetical protein GCM10007966_06800 [Legionella impletisoli]